MKGRKLLSKEKYSLLLDIYLGGVSGAIVHNGTIEHVSHNKISHTIGNEDTKIISQIESLLQKTIEDLISKHKVSNTYVFIDAPLSFSESQEVLFQNNDVNFFEQKNIKILENSSLDLPPAYTNVLGLHASDGIIIEYPPRRHTLNGYTTSNLTLTGERKAIVTQQWVQRNIYTAIKTLEQMYSLGTIIFLPDCFQREERGSDLLMIGEVTSVYYRKNKSILLPFGTGVAIAKQAHLKKQSFVEIESMLKTIARNHSGKNFLYKDMVRDFARVFSGSLKDDFLSIYNPHTVTYVGEHAFFPIVEEVLTAEKNVIFTESYMGENARLMYIVKNNVQ